MINSVTKTVFGPKLNESMSFSDALKFLASKGLLNEGELTELAISKKSGVELKEEADYEGEMAKSELYRIIENAEELFQMLDDDTQLEGWVQSKITKAADYLNSVTQYLKYQSVKSGVDEDLYSLDK